MVDASPEKRMKITKKIPRKPKSQDNPMVMREERISKCELLMLKMGSYKQAEIARELGVNIDTARTYIACVRKRWEVNGSHLKLQQARGAGMALLNQLTQEFCQIIENGKSRPEVKIKALKGLLDIHDKKLFLEGVTKNNLQEIPDTSANHSVNQRKEDAARMMGIVRKWCNYLSEKKAAGRIELQKMISV